MALVTHQPDEAKAFVLVNEDFTGFSIFFKHLSHLLLSDIRWQVSHKEATPLGEGLFPRFSEILQVNRQAFI